MKNPFARKLTIKQIVCLLLCTSAVLYVLHYLIFRDLHHIGIFFLHELAGMPLEVILVSLFFDKLIEKTHEEENQSKLSIIETLFFNESGGNMLRYLSSFDPNFDELADIMNVRMDWKAIDYQAARLHLKDYSFHLDVEKVDFFGLHYHLDERHAYYRNILENPALTQSSEFTELVMKIYLMWEELDCRTDLYNLDLHEKHYLGELLTEIYEELAVYWLDNAHNHSIHNRPRLHRVIETSPFAQ
ncbi:MAG: hypothetical protein IKU58_03495 [Clostridia bacterium]|nr:hypothetical protein [Clostridia bacterium]